MGPCYYFELPAGWDRRELYRGLAQKFSIQPMAARRSLIKYYDSFDWRLHANRLILAWDGTRLSLWPVDQSPGELQCPYDHEPRFVKDLPAGLLCNRLTPLIGFRALIPVITIRGEAHGIKFLDQEDKTVCSGFLERNQASSGHAWKRFRPVFSLVPLKGYGEWITTLTGWLQQNGFQPLEQDFYYQAAAKLRIVPGNYSTRVIELQPGGVSMQQAAMRILKQQLAIAAINENGIRQDIDTEFLHDFRVAVRRVRSLLGNLKEYLNPAVYRRAREDFTDLITLTNARRDLDIFLQRQSACLQVLPVRYRRVITVFFEDLQVRRNREQKKISQYLGSARYRRLRKYWNNRVQKNSGMFRKTGGRPVKIQDAAQKIIFNRYKKVAGFNRDLPQLLVDDYLHRIRIECKKLRYVLEFFLPLFAVKPLTSMVKKLKVLQDTLGEYNDLRLQQYRLKVYRDNLRRRKKSLAALHRALDLLQAGIQERKSELQLLFRSQFADFCKPGRQQELSEILNIVKNP